MAIVDMKKNKTLTATDKKNAVMRTMGWNGKKETRAEYSAKYNKAYDQYRNQVRNYETIAGKEKGSVNAGDMFYKSRTGRGIDSATRGQMRAISVAPSSSTGKVKRVDDQLKGVSKKAEEKQIKGIKRSYKEMIASHKEAREIMEKATSAKELREGLEKFAENNAEYTKNYLDAYEKKTGFRPNTARYDVEDYDEYLDELEKEIEN